VNLNDPERDLLGAIVNWVEHDVAPDKIIATRYVGNPMNEEIARTRPLCPYPQVAQYRGSGSINEADNFVCALPTE
jgi:feruloyl esterase